MDYIIGSYYKRNYCILYLGRVRDEGKRLSNSPDILIYFADNNNADIQFNIDDLLYFIYLVYRLVRCPINWDPIIGFCVVYIYTSLNYNI